MKHGTNTDTTMIRFGHCDTRKSKDKIRVRLRLETIVFFVFKSSVHKFGYLLEFNFMEVGNYYTTFISLYHHL